MYSIANFPKKSSTKIKVMVTLALIVLTSIWFAWTSQPVRHVAPDLVIMKRESYEISPQFEEALSVSMRRSDGRLVNWEWVA